MRKLAIINYKGGTAKTSTVVNVAHGLALKGKSVLVVDTDPQGSSGYYFGVCPQKTLYDVLMKKYPLKECIINARKNVDILCSNEHIFSAEIKLAQQEGREQVLSQQLKEVCEYDFVLIDCAPSMNLMNQNALMYCNEILLPVSMEYLSLIGVKQLLKNIKIINRIFGKDIQITKVIPTFYDKRNKKSKDILESLERVFPNSLSSPIRASVSLSEAPGSRRTIFEYAPNSKGAEDYYRLIEEVLSSG